MVSCARPAVEGSVNLKQHGAAPRRSRLGASWAQAWRRYPLHRSHWSVGTFFWSKGWIIFGIFGGRVKRGHLNF